MRFVRVRDDGVAGTVSPGLKAHDKIELIERKGPDQVISVQISVVVWPAFLFSRCAIPLASRHGAPVLLRWPIESQGLRCAQDDTGFV